MEQATYRTMPTFGSTNVHQFPIRSGHSPELPMDPVDFTATAPAPVFTDPEFLEELLQAEDQQLHSALERGYAAGLKEGSRNLHSWCAASMIGGAVCVLLFAGAFPEWASLIVRQPAPLVPAALASLNATSR